MANEPNEEETTIQTAPGLPPLRLVNVCGVVRLGYRDLDLDLQAISDKYWHTEYNTKKPYVLVGLLGATARAKINAKGILTFWGGQSEAHAVFLAKRWARLVHKSQPWAGVRVIKPQAVRVHNMMATCNVGFAINLDRLQQGYPHRGRLEREMFSGLVYDLPALNRQDGTKSRIKASLYARGKITIAGANTREELVTAFQHIYPIVQQYQLAPEQAP